MSIFWKFLEKGEFEKSISNDLRIKHGIFRDFSSIIIYLQNLEYDQYIFSKHLFQDSVEAVRLPQLDNFFGGFWGPRPLAPVWHLSQIFAPKIRVPKNRNNHDYGFSTVNSLSPKLQVTLFLKIRWKIIESRDWTRCAKLWAGPVFGHTLFITWPNFNNFSWDRFIR